MNVPDEKVANELQRKAMRMQEDWVAFRQELERNNIRDVAIEDLTDVIEHTLPIVLKSVGVTVATFVTTLLENADRRERLRIHSLIGDVLAAECHIPTDQGKIAAYYLMSPSGRCCLRRYALLC